MRIGYPRSLFKLLLLGYALALLPLLFALVNAAIHVDALAEKSRITLSQATQSTRTSHVMLEQIRLMERSARQYFVLQDAGLFNNYLYAHAKFETSINSLIALNSDKNQLDALEKIRQHESTLNKKITSLPSAGIHADAALAEFAAISRDGEKILLENDKLIDIASTQLSITAADTQKMMLWQALTLIPIAFMIALTITVLVAKPIRRMDIAIRQLGQGKYDRIIHIDGPGDLKTLGERLEWLRAQLAELDQQKQRFLRHISHELKTPLTAIREGSELLRDQVGGNLNQQQLEIADIIRENSLRLQHMIENMLNFTAAQHQTLKLNKTDIDIKEILNRIIHQYALSIENKTIAISKSYNNDDAYIINADKDKMLTIFDNLISNAIKYSPQAGELLISITNHADQIVIKVQDQGVGVSELDRPHVFSPFYRGQFNQDKGVQENLVGGTGLGLSISREYVEAHGGQITLMETNIGACFSVCLPVRSTSK